PAVARKTRAVGAGNSGNDPSGIHLADAIVAVIRNKQIARSIYGNPGRSVESSVRGGGSVPIKTRRPAARHRANNPIGIYFENTVIARVSNGVITPEIKCDTIRSVQSGEVGCPAIARKTNIVGAGHGDDDPVGVHLPDTVIEAICDQETSVGGGGHAGCITYTSIGGLAAIACIGVCSVSRYRRDDGVRQIRAI